MLSRIRLIAISLDHSSIVADTNLISSMVQLLLEPADVRMVGTKHTSPSKTLAAADYTKSVLLRRTISIL